MDLRSFGKREKFICACISKDCSHGCTDYHQNTKECPRTLDHLECKQAIRHLNETSYQQLSVLVVVTLPPS